MKNLGLLFNIINIVCSALMLGNGITNLAYSHYFREVIVSIYIVSFGLINLFYEIRPPSFIILYLGFFQTWLGRGLFYILAGVLSIVPDWRLIWTIPLMVVGVVYSALQFTKTFSYPSSLMNSDSQKEQSVDNQQFISNESPQTEYPTYQNQNPSNSGYDQL
eukprot:TRINITY_DN120_c0_g1_i1.p1 TRINITY_DN120_c0_g1~~TRINITY_DN120_c0_g1_i1.p1  ORF type:complete len:162 (+),score=17.06 TRINITY_DN120_c0_g1_i1:68-553(+)